MVEEEQQKVNGYEEEVDATVEKDCEEHTNGGSIVNGNRRDDVEGSYVFVDYGNSDSVGGSPQPPDAVVDDKDDLHSGGSLDVVLEAGSGNGDLGKKDAVSEEVSVIVDGDAGRCQQPEIPSDHKRELVTDECRESGTVESHPCVQETGDCQAEMPQINGTEEGFHGTTVSSEPTVEVDESDNNGELKTENQSRSDSHHDPEGQESFDATNCPAANPLSFDCCCVSMGGGLSKSSPSIDDSVWRTVVGKGNNLDVSFDCCSVPVGSCGSRTVSSAGDDLAGSAVGPAGSTPVENSEGTKVEDDEPVAENKTLDVQNSSGDINICRHVATVTDHVESVPNRPGSEISRNVMESTGSQHPLIDETNGGSDLVGSPEKEERDSTNSCGDSTVEIIVEGKSAPVEDTADKSFDVSEDMNGDTVPDSDGKQLTHIDDTSAEAKVIEESAKNERNMPSGDESIIEEAIDSSIDASGNVTVVSAPGAVEAIADQGVCLDNDDKSNYQESVEVSRSQEDEAATSSREIPIVEEVVIRPFYFLARHPRFEDTNLRNQLELAQLEVDEKTRERDVIRMEIQDIRSTCKGCNDEVEAAISKERGMRDLLRSKRQEIDALQSTINRVKNAIYVEDIDGRIYNMQHMIEHETLPLNEEKQFIREINQLRQLRAQLSANVGKGDEVQKAMDEKDKNEERLKALKKEADTIRVKLSRFEDDRKSSKDKYFGENKRLSDLQVKFKAANDIRQSAYTHLQSLRKQLYEKNKYFRGYKDDIKTVDNYISTKNKVELHHYCVKQVELFMDLWNNNAEFRKEYIKCNTRSTLRRLGTMDGRSLGPEEKSAVIPPVIMYNTKFAKVKSASQTSYLEQEKRVSNVEAEKIDDKPAMNVVEPNTQTSKSAKSKKSAAVNSAPAVSGRVEIEESTEVSKELKEEEEAAKELARREEERRKEEEAARLKELRRLEEKVKAKEAMERKKRQAEKAQARAALRAQKEAEERERERERRAKKKEKKTTALEVTDSGAEGQIPPTFKDQREDVKEPESKDKPNTVSKKPQKPLHFTKQTKSVSVPLPLRNRGKKRMQSWAWFLVVALLVFAVFLLGSSSLSLQFGLERFGF